ncbi:uncharacterized protein LOC122050536 [Zingiber officinale]|uniref:uncharacterized protein LOC122050536 n=1 Tax=Zingiber officinale TaxID=94328 RepID=UPI001C4B1C9B|nr:uncharacterized protein LOC122050536 [Zingiber officinale]
MGWQQWRQERQLLFSLVFLFLVHSLLLCTGGIYRHKIHISRIKGKGVKSCGRATEEQKEKYRSTLEDNKSKKLEKVLNQSKIMIDVVMTLNSHEEEDDAIAIIEKESKKRSINVGPINQFAKSIKVDDASMSASKKIRQQNINDAIAKKRLLEVHQYLARWEASNDVHTAQYIFDYINACIIEVGPQNVVQIVTDNASNNMAAAKLSKKGKEAFDVVLPNDFWNSMDLCLQIFTPLIKVLRLVDGEEKPSMGFVYREILNAKEEIRKTFKEENDYLPILNIIDSESKGHLDGPLHTTAYLLNP